MNIKELQGKEVLDMNAKNMGKVSDIEFDLMQGVIKHVELKGGKQKCFFLPEEVDKIGDRIILKVSEEQIQKRT